MAPARRPRTGLRLIDAGAHDLALDGDSWGCRSTLRLLPGQRVVVRDDSGEFFAGTVGPAAGPGESVRIIKGVRLPWEHVVARTRADPRDPLQELLDLLGGARDALRQRGGGAAPRSGAR